MDLTLFFPFFSADAQDRGTEAQHPTPLPLSPQQVPSAFVFPSSSSLARRSKVDPDDICCLQPAACSLHHAAWALVMSCAPRGARGLLRTGNHFQPTKVESANGPARRPSTTASGPRLLIPRESTCPSGGPTGTLEVEAPCKSAPLSVRMLTQLSSSASRDLYVPSIVRMLLSPTKRRSIARSVDIVSRRARTRTTEAVRRGVPVRYVQHLTACSPMGQRRILFLHSDAAVSLFPSRDPPPTVRSIEI